MSYFDSPKNQSLWRAELASLRKQREQRALGLDPTVGSARMEEDAAEKADFMSEMSGSYRERTTYQELLAEEAASIKGKKASKEKAVEKSKSVSKEDMELE